MPTDSPYVGRGGEKLRVALDRLSFDLSEAVAADLGCNVGGFTDCLLQAGAVRVYAVDTGYGTLDWNLRNDERVVVMERTNALHVELPEAVNVVTSDVAWTRQRLIVPAALKLLKPGGTLFSLFKPQYEAPRELLRRGKLPEDHFETVLEATLAELGGVGLEPERVIRLPRTARDKNLEAFFILRPPRTPEGTGR